METEKGHIMAARKPIEFFRGRANGSIEVDCSNAEKAKDADIVGSVWLRWIVKTAEDDVDRVTAMNHEELQNAYIEAREAVARCDEVAEDNQASNL